MVRAQSQKKTAAGSSRNKGGAKKMKDLHDLGISCSMQNENPSSKISSGKGKDREEIIASGSGPKDSSPLRRSTRESLMKKLVASNSNSRKSERLENPSVSTPLKKGRIERKVKKVDQSPLRKSERIDKSSATSSSGCKKYSKSSDSSGKKEGNAVKNEGEDKSKNLNVRISSTDKKRKQMTARSYRASLMSPPAKKVKKSDSAETQHERDSLAADSEAVLEDVGRCCQRKISEQNVEFCKGELKEDAECSSPCSKEDSVKALGIEGGATSEYADNLGYSKCSDTSLKPTLGKISMKEPFHDVFQRLLDGDGNESDVCKKKTKDLFLKSREISFPDRSNRADTSSENKSIPVASTSSQRTDYLGPDMIVTSKGNDKLAQEVHTEDVCLSTSSAKRENSEKCAKCVKLTRVQGVHAKDSCSCPVKRINDVSFAPLEVADQTFAPGVHKNDANPMEEDKVEGTLLSKAKEKSFGAEKSSCHVPPVCTTSVDKNIEKTGESPYCRTLGSSKKHVCSTVEPLAEIQTDCDPNVCVLCRQQKTELLCHGKGCSKRYHLSCLDPPLPNAPGIWLCISCIKKKIEFGVYSVSVGIDSVWNFKEGEQNNKQYLVKYKGLAHAHNQWISETQMLQEAPSLLSKFNRNYQKNMIIRWKQEWTVPHRLLQKRLLMPQELADQFFEKLGNNFTKCYHEWYVKWKGLGYEDATWELESSQFLRTPDALLLMKDYEVRLKGKAAFDSSNANKALEFRRKPFHKLTRLPDGCPPGLDNDHLDSTNKLFEFWHRSQNTLFIDDQERVIKSILFIMSLQSYACRPFLIICPSTSLSTWESEFHRLAPSINLIVYNGIKHVRQGIQNLEFYEDGGHIKFQVFVSHADAILEDFDKLEYIGWEALLVDDCQNPKISKHLEFLKRLSTGFRLLLFSNLVKDKIADYLNLLSFLDSGMDNNSSFATAPDSNDATDTLTLLKERLSHYVAYERKPAQRSLHLLLKPELSKLCEILKLPENVADMAQHFLEYIMYNHHVNPEPEVILQAFKISLCWRAAAFLKHKIDHEETLALAKKYLNFTCDEDQASNIYSKLRILKKKFSQKDSASRKKRESGPPSSGADITEEPVSKMSTDSSGPNVSELEKGAHNEDPEGHNVLEQLMLPEQEQDPGCATHADLQEHPGSRNDELIRNQINSINKICSRREADLCVKQNEEILDFNKHKEKMEMSLKKEHEKRIEPFLAMVNDSTERENNIRLSSEIFAKKMAAFSKHTSVQYEKLKSMQSVTTDKEHQIKNHWLEEAKGGKLEAVNLVDFFHNIPLSDSGFTLEEFKVLDQDDSHDSLGIGTYDSDTTGSFQNEQTGNVLSVSNLVTTERPSKFFEVAIASSPEVTGCLSGQHDAFITQSYSVDEVLKDLPLEVPSSVPFTDIIDVPMDTVALASELPIMDIVTNAVDDMPINCRIAATEKQGFDENSERSCSRSCPSQIMDQGEHMNNGDGVCLATLSTENQEPCINEHARTDNSLVFEGQGIGTSQEIPTSNSSDFLTFQDELLTNNISVSDYFDNPLPVGRVPMFVQCEDSIVASVIEQGPSRQMSGSLQNDTPMSEPTMLSSALVSQIVGQSILENSHMRLQSSIGEDLTNVSRQPETFRYPLFPLIQLIPTQGLQSEPLKNELARIRMHQDRIGKMHEDMKLKLKLECDQEILKAQKKYDMLLQDAESEYVQSKKTLATIYDKVFMNQILAEEFRAKFVENQGGSSSTSQGQQRSLRHLLQASQPQFVQRAASSTISMSSSLPVTRPSAAIPLPVKHPSAAIPLPVTRPSAAIPLPVTRPSAAILPPDKHPSAVIPLPVTRPSATIPLSVTRPTVANLAPSAAIPLPATRPSAGIPLPATRPSAAITLPVTHPTVVNLPPSIPLPVTRPTVANLVPSAAIPLPVTQPSAANLPPSIPLPVTRPSSTIPLPVTHPSVANLAPSAAIPLPASRPSAAIPLPVTRPSATIPLSVTRPTVANLAPSAAIPLPASRPSAAIPLPVTHPTVANLPPAIHLSAASPLPVTSPSAAQSNSFATLRLRAPSIPSGQTVRSTSTVFPSNSVRHHFGSMLPPRTNIQVGSDTRAPAPHLQRFRANASLTSSSVVQISGTSQHNPFANIGSTTMGQVANTPNLQACFVPVSGTGEPVISNSVSVCQDVSSISVGLPLNVQDIGIGANQQSSFQLADLVPTIDRSSSNLPSTTPGLSQISAADGDRHRANSDVVCISDDES